MNEVRAVHVLVVLSLSLGAAAGCEKTAPAASPSPIAAAPSPPSDAASPGPPAAACGNAGQPRCPLQEWMHATLQAYLARDDVSNLPRIAAALDKLANAGPAEYANWGSLARRGSEAARHHDFPALKENCVGCHDAYRTEFRGHMRARRLF